MQINWRDPHLWTVIASGLLLGLASVLLALWGNPANSGICVSCFLENSAGALGLHDNARMQYLRPELIGFVLGAWGSAAIAGEFRSRSGGGLELFFAGFFLIVGCAVFIGCPIKLFIRLSAGDLTAIAGVVGLVLGVRLGVLALMEGGEINHRHATGSPSGYLVPILFLLLLLFMVLRPSFLLFSESGGGTQYAPLWMAFAAGLLLGVVAQRSRFCITGTIRDIFLLRGRSYLLYGGIAFVLALVVGNLATGQFRMGLYGQPGAHLDTLWNFLGMFLVGWISLLIGGCPFRQLIKAGEGDGAAGLAVLGMVVAGGMVQAWDIAATAAGVGGSGKIAVLAGLGFAAALTLYFRRQGAAG